MSHTRRTASEVASAMYADDAASQALGIENTVEEPGKCVATMTVMDDMVNGLGVCHGGIVFTLADSAMAFACNAGDEATFAINAEIDWLGPARAGDELVATAQTVAEAGRTRVHDVTVTCAGNTIAVFRGRTRTVGGPVSLRALVPPEAR